MPVDKATKCFREPTGTTCAATASNQTQEPNNFCECSSCAKQRITRESLKKKLTNITILSEYNLKKASIARCNTCIAVLGKQKLDFHQAQFPTDGSVVSIKIVILLGMVKLIVAPHVSVSAKTIMFFAAKSIDEYAAKSLVSHSLPHQDKHWQPLW